MATKHQPKRSIADVAQKTQVAIDGSALKAKRAVEKLAEATEDVMTSVRGKVQVTGTAAAKKIRRVAGKLEDASRRVGKKPQARV